MSIEKNLLIENLTEEKNRPSMETEPCRPLIVTGEENSVVQYKSRKKNILQIKLQHHGQNA